MADTEGGSTPPAGTLDEENPPPPGMTSDDAVSIARGIQGPLVKKLGIEFLEFGERRVRARMPVAGNTQPLGLLHGGATASLCETVASVGTAFLVGVDKLSVGVDLSITHLRSARDGWVTVTAVPLRIGRTVAHWDMRVHDDEGRLVAVSRLTLSVRDTPSAR
jgi:1,4-dihydroxy-2-naphthoyl-CoA hydrolase